MRVGEFIRQLSPRDQDSFVIIHENMEYSYFFGFMHVTVVVLLSQQIHQPPPCPLLFPAMAVTGTVRGLIQSAAIPAATVFF